MPGERSEALIVVDPEVMGGKPVVRRTRITVEHIIEQLRHGHTIEDLLNDHPRLTREGIEAALVHALQAVRSKRVLSAP